MQRHIPSRFWMSGTFVGIGITLSACTVQLTAPYSQDIYQAATNLQDEFLVFAANMQMQAGKPDGYYSNHQKEYAEFEAQLAVMRMRSASLSTGVPCGHALDAGKKAGRVFSGPVQSQLSNRISQPEWANASCITILVTIAGEQMERLRSQHEIRCNPTAKKELCTTLFASPPIFSIVSTDQSDAPLVSAVAISLNELVGAEHDLKPESKS